MHGFSTELALGTPNLSIVLRSTIFSWGVSLLSLQTQR